MAEHLKLSLWDAFAFFLSGWTVCVSAYIHVAVINPDINEHLGKLPPTALGFAAFLVPLIAGLLFEPIGNKLGDFVFWIGSLLRSLGSKLCKCIKPTTATQASPLVERAKNSIPSELTEAVNPYHWAKDCLSQEKIETPYMAFLSKFGFYRNVGALLLLNAVLIPCLHGFGTAEKILFFSLLPSAVLYFVRSQRFYRHMGDSTFRNYAILLERKKSGETPEKYDSLPRMPTPREHKTVESGVSVQELTEFPCLGSVPNFGVEDSSQSVPNNSQYE